MELQVKIGEQPADFGRIAQNKSISGSLSTYGLAVQELTSELAEQLGYQGRSGVIISEVEPGSAAEQSGLKPGQLIEEVNKLKITSLEDLQQAVQQSPDSSRVLLRVRSGQTSLYVVLRTE
jgi:serine protease Do